IDGVLDKARAGVGAVAAIPLSDTVKDVEQERITKTVPRNRLWRAQTPQGFPRAMIEQAYAGLANGDAAPPDDAELCERAGLPVADRDMAEAQGLGFNEAASALARAFWPGPLTLVLPGGSGRLPDALRGPEGGIAVRWTSHRGMARLARALGEPVTSTSANLPGAPPAPGAEAIARDFAPALEAG